MGLEKSEALFSSKQTIDPEKTEEEDHLVRSNKKVKNSHGEIFEENNKAMQTDYVEENQHSNEDESYPERNN